MVTPWSPLPSLRNAEDSELPRACASSHGAIYADDQPVGFAMLSWNVTPNPPRIIGPWLLWKLLIDERYQGGGHGREAARLVADIARDQGASELLTSYIIGEKSAESFYRQIGFIPTGEQDEKGEKVLALRLRN